MQCFLKITQFLLKWKFLSIAITTLLIIIELFFEVLKIRIKIFRYKQIIYSFLWFKYLIVWLIFSNEYRAVYINLIRVIFSWLIMKRTFFECMNFLNFWEFFSCRILLFLNLLEVYELCFKHDMVSNKKQIHTINLGAFWVK